MSTEATNPGCDGVWFLYRPVFVYSVSTQGLHYPMEHRLFTTRESLPLKLEFGCEIVVYANPHEAARKLVGVERGVYSVEDLLKLCK